MHSHAGRLSRSPSDWGAPQLRFIVELRAHSNFNLYLFVLKNGRFRSSMVTRWNLYEAPGSWVDTR